MSIDEEHALSLKVVRLEVQISRIIADIESEKGTRARVNDDIYRKLDDIRDRAEEKFNRLLDGQQKNAKINWMMLGGLMVIEFLSRFIH